MQPRMNALIFQMITNMLEYGSSKYTTGIAKSLSNDKNIDKSYLAKVIEGCKSGPKEPVKKAGVNIQFGKGKKGAGDKTKPKPSVPTKDKNQIQDQLSKLEIQDSSDSEEEKDIDA
jgi:hypothetical protein